MNFLPLIALLIIPAGTLAHGELDARLKSISTEIERSTNNAQLYVQRAELHREHRDWSAALADYQRAGALDANLVRLDFFRARMFSDAGDASRSRALLDTYLIAQTNDAEAFVFSAKLFSRENRSSAAIEHYSRAITIAPQPDPELFLSLADLFVAENKTLEAVRTLDQGVDTLGSVMTLQLRAWELELRMTNRVAALTRLDKIIKSSPRKEAWLVKRGELLVQTGSFLEARTAFNDAANAIAALPMRLQESDAMKKLSAEIGSRLAELDDKSSIKPTPAR